MVFPSPVSVPQQPHGGGGTPAEELIRRDMERRMRGAEGIEAKRNFPEVFGPPRYGEGSRRDIMRRLALRDQKKEWFRPDMNRDEQRPWNSDLPPWNIPLWENK